MPTTIARLSRLNVTLIETDPLTIIFFMLTAPLFGDHLL
jgi:hypothetical protein